MLKSQMPSDAKVADAIVADAIVAEAIVTHAIIAIFTCHALKVYIYVQNVPISLLNPVESSI